MSGNKSSKKHPSTLAALLKEKPKRGRPSRSVSRQNVYVALSEDQKGRMYELTANLPKGLVRADLPDLAISFLAARLDALRRDVADRGREIPEGVTDMDSLYLLWDLPLPEKSTSSKWTSIRVSPQQAIELGRAQGTLNAIFGANRSEVFSLGLTLLDQFLQRDSLHESRMTLAELRDKIRTYSYE